jgi:hypothetical protein
MVVAVSHKRISNRTGNTLLKLGRVQWRMLQLDPLRGLDNTDVSAVCRNLVWIVQPASQVSKHTGLTCTPLPDEHDLGREHPLLAELQGVVECTDCGPAILRNLGRNTRRFCFRFLKKRALKFGILQSEFGSAFPPSKQPNCQG